MLFGDVVSHDTEVPQDRQAYPGKSDRDLRDLFLRLVKLWGYLNSSRPTHTSRVCIHKLGLRSPKYFGNAIIKNTLFATRSIWKTPPVTSPPIRVCGRMTTRASALPFVNVEARRRRAFCGRPVGVFSTTDTIPGTQFV